MKRSPAANTSRASAAQTTTNAVVYTLQVVRVRHHRDGDVNGGNSLSYGLGHVEPDRDPGRAGRVLAVTLDKLLVTNP